MLQSKRSQRHKSLIEMYAGLGYILERRRGFWGWGWYFKKGCSEGKWRYAGEPELTFQILKDTKVKGAEQNG